MTNSESLDPEELKKRFSRYGTQTETFASDAIRFLSASKRAQSDLKTRSHLRRFIGALSGANNRVRDISQENLASSVAATHRVMEHMSQNLVLLSDSLLATQQGLRRLTQMHDQWAEASLKMFIQIGEKLHRMEQSHDKALEDLGIDVGQLKVDVKLLQWKAALDGRSANLHALAPFHRLVSLACEFVHAKPKFWSQTDLDMFKGALTNPGKGAFPKQSMPFDSFLAQVKKLFLH